MAKKYLVEYHNGIQIIHYDGCIQPGDLSLCGSDLIGDSGRNVEGWGAARETDHLVNCVHCLRIVEYCRKIKAPLKGN